MATIEIKTCDINQLLPLPDCGGGVRQGGLAAQTLHVLVRVPPGFGVHNKHLSYRFQISALSFRDHAFNDPGYITETDCTF
jgi:hypothetical protein